MQLKPRESQRRHWYVVDVPPVNVATLPVIESPSRTSGAVQLGSAVRSGGWEVDAMQPASENESSESVRPELSASGPANQNVQRSIGSSVSEVCPPNVRPLVNGTVLASMSVSVRPARSSA